MAVDIHGRRLKMKYKFLSAINYMFPEYEYLERYEAAAIAGFEAVESAYPYLHSVEQLLEAKNKAGIEHAALVGKTLGDSLGHAALPGKEREFMEEFEISFKYTKELNCPSLHMLSGRFPDEKSQRICYKEYEQTYVKNLSFAAKKLNEIGVTLLIEPISTRPLYLLTHTDQALDIIKEVDEPNIKLLLDFFHAQMTHGNLANTIEKAIPYLGYVQISQAPTRGEPDSKGEINYPWLLEHLHKCGYDGWVGCEYRPLGKTEDGLGWMSQYVL